MEEINQRVLKIAELLDKNNPNPETELVHKNDYELVVAVMLSAQTTDKKVNQVTPNLFLKYPDWNSLANADILEVQNIIRSVNFYKGKGERLVNAAKYIVLNYGGMIPKTIFELIKIPGIARKSANVILQEIWGLAEGIVVDTHVSRVSKRLGLTSNSDPVKIEYDLLKIIPKNYWRNISGNFVLHGRYVCTARKPKCLECLLKEYCPTAFKV